MRGKMRKTLLAIAVLAAGGLTASAQTAGPGCFHVEQGTPAIRWKDDIPLEVKQDRLQRLLDLQEAIGNEIRQEMLGNTYEVLVERFNKDGQMLKGRTRCWKKVIFDGPENLIGTLQPIKVHSYSHETLLGEIAKPEESIRLKVI